MREERSAVPRRLVSLVGTGNNKEMRIEFVAAAFSGKYFFDGDRFCMAATPLCVMLYSGD